MKLGCARDRGVTIVEAAFALPILLMFMFGLIDLGMWAFNANQATNAARDGARTAILQFEDADVTSPDSDDHEAVVAAAIRRLDGEPAEVTVRCVDNEGQELASCADAEPDLHSVRVDVEWGWQFLTPIAGILGSNEGRAHGSATMSIVGLPFAAAPGATTTTIATGTPDEGDDPGGEEEFVDPEACQFVAETFAVSPSTISTTGSGSNQLVQTLDFEFGSNGSLDCQDRFDVILGPAINDYDTNPANDKIETFSCGCGDGPSHEGSYTGSTNIWKTTGGWTAVLTMDGVEVDSDTFTVVSG